jgi:Uncharacterized protein conserved in bacteria
MANIEVKVEKLIKNPIEEIGYNLYDLEYLKEGKDYYLRIFIDKQEGITLDDCEKVNNIVSEIMDINGDIISEQYYLEISSPGIERRLSKNWHFDKYLNKKVEISLFKPMYNTKQKKYIGILKSYNNDCLVIEMEENVMDFDRKNISLVKNVFEW